MKLRDREPGLYVSAATSGDPILAQPTPRVFKWFSEAVKTAGLRVIVTPRRSRGHEGCDCLQKHIDLPFDLEEVAVWEPKADGHTQRADALRLSTGVAVWSEEKLDKLIARGTLFGAKDIVGGTACVQYFRSAVDHICVISLARGRQVELYVCCAGSCRDEYEAFMEAQKARASTPNLRVVSRHSENYILPQRDGVGPERLIVKPSALEAIAQALKFIARLYASASL